jgi:Tfp pilus assembly protein PilF
MRPENFYDLSALSRALYQRGDSACGIEVLGRAMTRGDFDRQGMLDTYVRYGTWLANAGRDTEALQTFSNALDIDPDHIVANYSMGLLLKNKGTAYLPEAMTYFRRANFAPGYTDEDDQAKANAANELSINTTDPAERAVAKENALRLYREAIALNTNAVTAIWDRGLLYDRIGETALADRDLHQAALLHTHDATMLQSYADFLTRHGRSSESARYAAAARAATAARIPKDEALEWQPSPVCRYHQFDLTD